MTTSEREYREVICEVGRRLYNKGFAAANDGNISIRLNRNEILCTPTGVSKGYMKPDDLCVVDPTGKQLRGVKKRTSEILLHLSIYRARPDIKAVIHSHPPHATAFAVAGVVKDAGRLIDFEDIEFPEGGAGRAARAIAGVVRQPPSN